MGRSFPPDGLVGPDFGERLSSFLWRTRETLGAAVIGVAELAAEEGELRPIWRAVAPGPLPPFGVPLLRELGAARSEYAPGDARLSELAPGVEGLSVVSLPIEVTPRLDAHPDAVAVIGYRERSFDETALDDLAVCLAAGLSQDRAQRLAQVVYGAIEQAADAIELTDQNARLIYVNRAWERFSGYARAEALGQTVGRLFRDTVAPVHDAAFYQFTLASLAAGKPWLGALVCRTRDGSRVLCEVNASPFEADVFRGNLAVRRDLTHRRERDAALANAHAEFRQVLSALPDGVAVLRDGKLYFANPAFLSMLGRDERSAIGRAYTDFVHPSDRESFETEGGVRATRLRFVRPDGTVRFAEVSPSGAISFEGRAATILVSHDTTERRVAQEQLARAEKLSAIGSLAAGVAHEVNNPLAYLILNLELLRESTADGAIRPDPSLLEEALDGAKRIRSIVSELREFSGSDAPGPLEPVLVERAATSALNIVQNEIRHRARLVRDHEPGLFALARDGELVQVLVNVLVNAAQAIPEQDGREHFIRVVTKASPKGDARIVISDTGSGISSELLPRVFDPFATSKPRGEGSGLGLAISKRIIEEFGGRIAVESSEGGGTTVTVDLVRAEAPEVPRSAPRVSGASPRPPGKRVLVVDDELPLARALKLVLRHHEVTTVHDGREAFDLLKSGEDFDVILCDLMMFGMTGAELYRRITALRSELSSRFIFMTGGTFTEQSHSFLETSDNPVLHKPFDPNRVREWVDARAAADSDRSGSGKNV
jgi:PAS domain S-box-containing protein